MEGRKRVLDWPVGVENVLSHFRSVNGAANGGHWLYDTLIDYGAGRMQGSSPSVKVPCVYIVRLKTRKPASEQNVYGIRLN